MSQLNIQKKTTGPVGVNDPFATYKKQPLIDFTSPTRMSSEFGTDQPITAALGAGRIAELKSQLMKVKVLLAFIVYWFYSFYTAK